MTEAAFTRALRELAQAYAAEVVDSAITEAVGRLEKKLGLGRARASAAGSVATSPQVKATRRSSSKPARRGTRRPSPLSSRPPRRAPTPVDGPPAPTLPQRVPAAAAEPTHRDLKPDNVCRKCGTDGADGRAWASPTKCAPCVRAELLSRRAVPTPDDDEDEGDDQVDELDLEPRPRVVGFLPTPTLSMEVAGGLRPALVRGRTVTCGRCGSAGHNARGCRVDAAPALT